MQDVYRIEGHIRQKRGDDSLAFNSYKKAFSEAQNSSDLIGSSKVCADISSLYINLNVRDSAIFYALKGYEYSKEVSFKKGIMLNCNLLAELYDSIQPSLALKYYKIAVATKDGLFGVNNLQAIQKLITAEEAKQKQLEEAEAAYKEKLRLYSLLSGLAAVFIIALILYRNNLYKQKSNVLLQHQKEKVENTLQELKSTQSQLIQSEKMASLGELTAGIAHEIQNPLNFVNNFSEVSNELIKEIQDERRKTKDLRDEAHESDLLKDIEQNLEKINHHGKRADAIVKGMLQHSRTSSGQKELTDVNALCDEYVRLSYHGLRAKDKSFNAKFETDFDTSLPKINVVPQDIGRVVLNLINNAFYAVGEKTKLQAEGYEPQVVVTTKKDGDKILISVKDNGNGIPQNIVDKIFQPFFTTKPTGQGTGLGLSLSYDIVKAHGGELRVNSTEGVETTFIIQLPL